MNQEIVDDATKEQTKKAINSACRMLAIREHSRKQLTEKLSKKGFNKECIAQAIEYLIQENWQSEERFCGSFIRSRAARGQGLARIEMELQLQGINSSLVEQCIVEEAIDWQQICTDAGEKKARTLSGFDRSCGKNQRQIDMIQERLKIERFLRFRGFSLDQIRTTIKHCLNIRSQVK
ncbi:MAG: recombination regulator RecX [Kangiellaceae bacterium]|nr:recombination regulator RecX [Kangiellaceae bacterium]